MTLDLEVGWDLVFSLMMYFENGMRGNMPMMVFLGQGEGALVLG